MTAKQMETRTKIKLIAIWKPLLMSGKSVLGSFIPALPLLLFFLYLLSAAIFIHKLTRIYTYQRMIKNRMHI